MLRRSLNLVCLLLAVRSLTAAPPVNDNRANATNIETGHRLRVALAEATVELDEPIPPHYSAAGWSKSVWFKWVAPASAGWYRVQTTIPRVAVWRLEPSGALLPIYSPSVVSQTSLYAYQDDLFFPTTTNSTYLVGLAPPAESDISSDSELIITPVTPPAITVETIVCEPSTIDSASENRTVKMSMTLKHAPGLSLNPHGFLLPPIAIGGANEVLIPSQFGLHTALKAQTPSGSIWEATTLIPKGTPAGQWVPSAVEFSNGLSRAGDAYFADTAFPIAAPLVITNTGAVDREPPVVLSSEVIVDTQTPPRGTVKVVLSDPAGLALFPLPLYLRETSSNYSIHINKTVTSDGPTHTITGNFSLLPEVIAGSYALHVEPNDYLGNGIKLDSSNITFPGPFKNTIPLAGIAIPTVQSLEFVPTIADTTNSDVTVTAKIHIKGLNDLHPTFFLESASGLLGGHALQAYNLKSGTLNDGIWELPFNLKKGSAHAILRPTFRVISPFTFDSRSIEFKIPLPPFIAPQITGTASVDHSAPSISSIAVSPAALDLRVVPRQTITLEVAAADPSGVYYVTGSYFDSVLPDYAYPSFSTNSPTRTFEILTSTATAYGPADTILISGTAQSGVWSQTGVVSENTPPGKYYWKSRIADRCGNSFGLESRDQNAPGTAPHIITVLNHPLPEVTVEFIPPTVDVSQRPAEVDVILNIKAEGGSEYVQADLRGISNNYNFPPIFGNQFSLANGDSKIGTWKKRITIPKGSKPGAVPLSFTVNQNGPDLSGLSTAKLEIINMGEQDTAPPTITSLNISPAIIDVSEGSRSFTVTLTAKDDVSGIMSGYVSSPLFSMNLEQLNLKNTNGNESTWSQVFTLTSLVEPSSYPVSVKLTDYHRQQTSCSSSDEKFVGPFKGNLIVQNALAPLLQELTLTPNEVDVSNSDQVIKVSLRAKTPGGLNNVNFYSAAHLAQGLRHTGLSTGQSGFSLKSGTQTEGVWEADLLIPKGTPPGELSFYLEASQVRGPSLTAGIDPTRPYNRIIVKVANSQDVDTTPPIIELLGTAAMQPAGFVSLGSVDVRVRVTDQLSGVQSVWVKNGEPFTLQSPLDGPSYLGRISLPAMSNDVVIKASDRLGNLSTRTISLSAPVVDKPYEQWATHHGIASGASPLLDSDEDGLNNLLELAFSTVPNQAMINSWYYAKPAYETKANPAERTSGLPAITYNFGTLSPGRLSASWWGLRGARALGLRYIPEGSSDLRNWQPLSPATSTGDLSASGLHEWLTTSDAVQADGKSRYLRVRVELSPR